MRLIDKIFWKISPKNREKLFYFNFIKHPIRKLKDIFILKDLYMNYNEKFGEYRKDREEIYITIKKMILKTNDGFNFAKAFYTDKIESIKQGNFKENNIILICLVKNDLKRLKEFYKYYINLGIVNFTFIDNGSTDGTFEYLEQLENISLFRVYEKYSTIRRQAWISKIMAYYGYNKWFLILDSDEFLVYNECEQRKVNELLEKLMIEKNTRIRALMIDMYSDGVFLEDKKGSEKFAEEYCYFDSDTYNIEKHKHFELVTGGMRKRVFGKYENINPFLIKYPIIYYEKGDIQYNSHYSYPFYKNFNININLVLLHYKFLPEDLEKIKNRVKEKNYALGSIEYNAYLKAYKTNEKLRLKYEKSNKYTNSKDLKKIKLINSIKWL